MSGLKAAARTVYGPFVDYWRRRPARFEAHMREYFSTHCTMVPPKSDDANLHSLIENGFVLLPEYYDRARIQAVHDKALPLVRMVKEGTAPKHWKTLNYGEDGIYRLQNIEFHLPDADFILKEAYLRSLVDAYLGGGPVRVKGNYIDYKPDLKHDHTSTLHMDSYQSQLKIFTMLTDVSATNAPTVYWAKSHRDGQWRRRFDFDYWRGDPVGIHGGVPPGIVREQRALGGPDALQERVITGTAGTVLIADTRGVHRASCLVEGYRLEIVQKFSL